MLKAVNFVGHAAVASWYDATPLFVLGAMLPDFFGMLGIKAAPTSPELSRGVAFHHASDAAFHQTPAFVDLTRRARQTLEEQGCPKGPARAVAHIGVELLLDPVLLTERGARAAYTEALERAIDVQSELALSPADETRFHELARLLLARGVPAHDDPEILLLRMRRALAHRPRLALTDASAGIVRNWVVAARPSVVGCASDVIRQMLSTLDDQGFGRATREEKVP